jgi:hypothetical protein
VGETVQVGLVGGLDLVVRHAALAG